MSYRTAGAGHRTHHPRLAAIATTGRDDLRELHASKALALDGAGEAADDAALGEEEEDERRNDRERREGEHAGRVGAVLGRVVRRAERQRPVVRLGRARATAG